MSAETTEPEIGSTDATRDVGSSFEALTAACPTGPISDSAEPGSPRTTSVNEPTVFWPK